MRKTKKVGFTIAVDVPNEELGIIRGRPKLVPGCSGSESVRTDFSNNLGMGKNLG
jgi:hypothetical protein